MNVGELIEVCGEDLKNIEVVVRDNGKWVQGYRIGKDAEVYPYEKRVELIEAGIKDDYHKTIRLKKEQIADVLKIGGLKMKVIAKRVSNAPDYVKALQVEYIIPRHIREIHGEQLFHNAFDLDITCYPEGFVPREEPKRETKEEPLQQLSIFDIGGTNGN